MIRNQTYVKGAFFAISILAAIGAPAPLNAEFLCRGEVSFKWKRDKAETSNEVFYARAEARGIDEEKAKGALALVTSDLKTQAVDKCRLDHENKSHCIASKFNSNSSLLQKMDFSSRKKLESAIEEDCLSSIGVCETVLASDPKCEEIIAPEGAKDEKGAGEKKEEKPKKK